MDNKVICAENGNMEDKNHFKNVARMLIIFMLFLFGELTVFGTGQRA